MKVRDGATALGLALELQQQMGATHLIHQAHLHVGVGGGEILCYKQYIQVYVYDKHVYVCKVHVL
jgi:hypothetical protein